MEETMFQYSTTLGADLEYTRRGSKRLIRAGHDKQTKQQVKYDDEEAGLLSICCVGAW
jgi:hypothetical protein